MILMRRSRAMTCLFLNQLVFHLAPSHSHNASSTCKSSRSFYYSLAKNAWVSIRSSSLSLSVPNFTPLISNLISHDLFLRVLLVRFRILQFVLLLRIHLLEQCKAWQIQSPLLTSRSVTPPRLMRFSWALLALASIS